MYSALEPCNLCCWTPKPIACHDIPNTPSYTHQAPPSARAHYHPRTLPPPRFPEVQRHTSRPLPRPDEANRHAAVREPRPSCPGWNWRSVSMAAKACSLRPIAAPSGSPSALSANCQAMVSWGNELEDLMLDPKPDPKRTLNPQAPA